jgi:hypothetical protein
MNGDTRTGYIPEEHRHALRIGTAAATAASDLPPRLLTVRTFSDAGRLPEGGA